MPAQIVCQQCGATLTVPEHLLYQAVRCGHCGSVNLASPAQTLSPVVRQQAGVGGCVASMVLGIIGLIAWCLPLIGFPINLVGLILGLVNVKNPEGRGMAIAGIVTSSIGLVLTIINAMLGAVMFQGWQPWQQGLH